MGRLSKLKKQAIEEANKRLLGEQYDEFEEARKQAWELNDEGDTDGDGITDRSDYFPDIDSQGGLEMDDIVSSLRDQLSKVTGKTFSPEQIAAKLKELKDEEMSRREDI